MFTTRKPPEAELKTLSLINASADACTQKPHKVTTACIPFPDLPDARTHPMLDFWLAAWIRDLAKKEALATFTKTATTQKATQKSKALDMAMGRASLDADYVFRKTTETLLSFGGLLFAHPESTKFTPGGAAC